MKVDYLRIFFAVIDSVWAWLAVLAVIFAYLNARALKEWGRAAERRKWWLSAETFGENYRLGLQFLLNRTTQFFDGRQLQPEPRLRHFFSANSYYRCLKLAVVYSIALTLIVRLWSGESLEFGRISLWETGTAGGRLTLIWVLVVLTGLAIISYRKTGWKSLAALSRWTFIFAGIFSVVVSFAAAATIIGYNVGGGVGPFAFRMSVLIVFAVGAVLKIIGAGTVGGVFLLILAIAYNGAGSGAFAFAVGLALSSAFTGAVAFIVGGAFAFAFAGAIALALVGASVIAYITEVSDRSDNGILGGVGIAAVLVGCIFLVGWAIDRWGVGVSEWGVGVSKVSGTLLFLLALLPVINAIFDWLSLGLSRWFLHQIAESNHVGLWAVGWGLLDLVAGAIILCLLVASASALIAVFDLNFAGQGCETEPCLPFDILAFLQDIPADRIDSKYMWVYLMVGSTLLPTLVHALLAIFAAVTALLPDGWRNWLALQITEENINDGDKQVGLTVALTALPTAAVGLAGGMLYGLWQLGSSVAPELGQFLLSVAVWSAELVLLS